MKQLFQYVVIYDEYEDGKYKDSKIIIDPGFMLAETMEQVSFKLIRKIPEEYDPHHTRIIIKNFNNLISYDYTLTKTL